MFNKDIEFNLDSVVVFADRKQSRMELKNVFKELV